jgi:iron(III) transport system ATP-binding protein
LPARLLRSRFLGDLALLEVAVHGFERPLLTLVREGEQPPQGEEVSASVDAESVLVFPAEASLADDAELIRSARESS